MVMDAVQAGNARYWFAHVGYPLLTATFKKVAVSTRNVGSSKKIYDFARIPVIKLLEGNEKIPYIDRHFQMPGLR